MQPLLQTQPLPPSCLNLLHHLGFPVVRGAFVTEDFPLLGALAAEFPVAREAPVIRKVPVIRKAPVGRKVFVTWDFPIVLQEEFNQIRHFPLRSELASKEGGRIGTKRCEPKRKDTMGHGSPPSESQNATRPPSGQNLAAPNAFARTARAAERNTPSEP